AVWLRFQKQRVSLILQTVGPGVLEDVFDPHALPAGVKRQDEDRMERPELIPGGRDPLAAVPGPPEVILAGGGAVLDDDLSRDRTLQPVGEFPGGEHGADIGLMSDSVGGCL